ncbi:hypothetical protein GOV03_00450, partial [Candidatus Woesearchaeota archaeon]|nr:hypothetical protein [Candidatus Woesearchaeota archaeon]
EGAYRFKIQGKDVEIKKEHLLIESSVPEPYRESSFKGGLVYVSLERTAELDAEGYAREIMRCVQQMRKEAGLEKKDKIDLFVKVSKALLGVDKFKNDIKEKVGAAEIEVAVSNPKNKFKNSSKKKVKNEEIGIWFS